MAEIVADPTGIRKFLTGFQSNISFNYVALAEIQKSS